MSQTRQLTATIATAPIYASVLAPLVQALFHVAEKPLLARYTSFEVTAYAMWSGRVFVWPWTGALIRALPHATAEGIGSAVFLGIAPSAIGFVLWDMPLPAWTSQRPR